jgi:hypothetical protein
MHRYRARQKKVTHQSSNRSAGDALLSADSAISTVAGGVIAVWDATGIHCTHCGCRCSASVRANFLRNRRIQVHDRSD